MDKKKARYIPATVAKQAVAGREEILLDAMGVPWRQGRPHIDCPYPAHGGKLDWRWDRGKKVAFCTCSSGDIFHVIMKVQQCNFNNAIVWAMETLGRNDLT